MEIYSICKNNRINSMVLYLFLFTSLVLGRDTLLSSVVIGFYPTQFILIVVLFCLWSCLLIKNRMKINSIISDKRFIFPFCLSALFILLLVIKRDFQMFYLSCCLAICFSSFISFTMELKSFSNAFIKTIIFLTVYSFLVNYILVNIIDLKNIEIVVNSANTEFLNFGLAFPVNQLNYIRNFSVFREPGVFNFFLTMAIILEIIVFGGNIKRNIIIVVILSLGVFSTFSTTGILGLVCIFVSLFIKKF